MFMDAAVEWVLGVILSLNKKTYAIYVTARLDNVHGRCSLLGPRCQPL
jgi:hypothetical protein